MKRQNQLYYENATLLKNALSFFGQWVLQTSDTVCPPAPRFWQNKRHRQTAAASRIITCPPSFSQLFTPWAIFFCRKIELIRYIICSNKKSIIKNSMKDCLNILTTRMGVSAIGTIAVEQFYSFARNQALRAIRVCQVCPRYHPTLFESWQV